MCLNNVLLKVVENEVTQRDEGKMSSTFDEHYLGTTPDFKKENVFAFVQ